MKRATILTAIPLLFLAIPVFSQSQRSINEPLPTRQVHLGQETPAVAMSGKFHKAWGEFGGFKQPDAIKLLGKGRGEAPA